MPWQWVNHAANMGHIEHYHDLLSQTRYGFLGIDRVSERKPYGSDQICADVTPM